MPEKAFERGFPTCCFPLLESSGKAIEGVEAETAKGVLCFHLQ